MNDSYFNPSLTKMIADYQAGEPVRGIRLLSNVIIDGEPAPEYLPYREAMLQSVVLGILEYILDTKKTGRFTDMDIEAQSVIVLYYAFNFAAYTRGIRTISVEELNEAMTLALSYIQDGYANVINEATKFDTEQIIELQKTDLGLKINLSPNIQKPTTI